MPAPKKPEDPQEAAKNQAIDKELERAKQQEDLKVKLLLLGAGESGKSTIFKQMRILHGAPRTEDDLRMYGVVVRSNIVTAMRKLSLWRPIKVLWQSKTMKEVWSRRAAMNVIDGHKEYLQDLPRIASPDFQPTQQDILLARVKTNQVVMERYRIDGIEFEMYDVGGQRSERRKWISCFENVDAVIFVAALSEYDQALAESKRTNRMSEALELFRSVCNNRAFANTSIMLFLNKKDVFAEKIHYSDIVSQTPFSDYPYPPREFNSGVLYFIEKFKECLIDDDFNDSFIHVTCATDTNNMEFVLDSTRTIIMTDNLRRSGFLGPG
ncbi:predicted protein [Phaeodactylum tricornutum CCAP 1055/1]|uniref:Uncharacterized protein n=2 Tax=Phaeodactylum tricornutum TaxID=2850 RepID=B5Y3H7_PHATC|nr:predicted protein [Phaeodactylum tricornutum CCAP 1055/1]ACI65128.1 predicted protein [Phaeodactylum tricornutum CCAP 1055/1]|eukprot:XP_002185658.1 predicted protein [Phaeodactylum tricornutum CCAP 1055/1]